MKRSFYFFMIMAFLFGCATYASLKPGNGTKIIFENRTQEEIWDAAQKALKKNNFWVVESSKEGGMIKAQNDGSGMSYGEIVGIFISKSKIGSNRYIVEIISKRLVATAFLSPDWERPLIEDMAKILNLPFE